METPFNITLLIILTVVCGIGSQVVAAYLKVPAIVFLLLFGILVGKDGLGLVHPNLLGSGLEVVVSLFVALILFEGGLNLELRELGRVSGTIRNLVTMGVLVTLIGGGMAAHWFGEFPWPIAFLYASLVVVTGPTVVGPLLKQVSVDRQVATLLEGEGVIIDPVGAILAVLVLNIVLNEGADPLGLFRDLVMRLGIGSIIGAAGGWLLGFGLKRAKFLSEELINLVVLATIWMMFGLAEEISSESGLVTTVVAGIFVGAAEIPELRLIRRFKGQLTMLAVSVLFILLAADLSLASVVALGWGSVLTVLTLMFLVRPLNILLCTWNSQLSWRQKMFVSWVAPRGIVSASVSSLFAILLTQKGINGGDSIKALVFLTIMMTVFSQGLTARFVAQFLGITSSAATGAVIVGSNPLSRLIGRIFRERGESVVLIDTDEERCKKAQEEGLQVYKSSALDIDVLEEAGLHSIGTFLAMTKNGEVNLVLAQRAAEEFKPPRVLAVYPKSPQAKNDNTNNSNSNSNNNSNNNNREKVQQAFTTELNLKGWNQYLSDKEVKLGETLLKNLGFEFQKTHLKALIKSGEFIPLLIERQGSLQVLSAMENWQPGDRIIYLLHDPKPKLLKRLSGSHQTTLTMEKHPAVEEVPIPSVVLDIDSDKIPAK
ncbi:cation:proton antiporter [Okeania sp.]|uniref:cation:proton antiporter n=1 Tax=Okeania sp. TaxID=3100323 RepID=UPI002B4AB187|nr:cation:proton antiporter [Okeania sp.]MEB3343592.1 cation:proton antiporter [Okeania sp.]